MRSTLFLLLLLNYFSLVTIAQRSAYKPDSFGTYLVVLIDKEGIVVGADSRASSLERGEGTPVYAYADGTEKIFRYNKLFFQIAGAYVSSPESRPLGLEKNL